MKKTTVETPSGAYSFYRESDADLTTTEDRIKWFSAHFEVEPPALAYDEDEPDQVLLTDELAEWARIEGVNLDWMFCGKVAGVVSAYREKHRVTPETEEWINLLGEFDDTEHKIFLAGLTLAVESDADMKSIMRGVSEKIQEYRAQSAC